MSGAIEGRVAASTGAARQTGQPNTFESIQALRGVAALLVVVFHAGLRVDFTQTTFRIGNSGVDIFFVISGFVMWTVTARRPTRPGVFLRHRFIRLIPLYWLFTLVTVAAWFIVPSAFPRMHPTLGHYLLSLAFIPHVSPDNGMIMPVLGQGWTLNFELFFYLLFAAVLSLPQLRRFATIGLILLALPVIGFLVQTPAVPVTSLLSPLLVEFLGGIVIARLVIDGVRLDPVWTLICVATGVVLLLCAAPPPDDDGARLLQYGLPAFLIVGGTVAAEINGNVRIGALPRWLGDASYSIYLSHTFVISALGKVWPHWTPDWAFLVAAAVCAALVGCAVYLLIERPMLSLMRGKRRTPTDYTANPVSASAPSQPHTRAAAANNPNRFPLLATAWHTKGAPQPDRRNQRA
jgi:exopolysaccharide production protein ExoZ